MKEPEQTLEAALFELAVQRPTAAERAAFLDGVCRDNPALRTRLDVLLEGHFGGTGFLTQATERDMKNIREQEARMIGRYKLLEKIGEGGFGEVWMAEQSEPVKRRVALKIVKLGMDSRQVVARFEAERQALAMMDHPNIAKIFDAGTTDSSASEISNLKSQIHGGRPYFVMELVRGIKITEYCDKNFLPTHERLKLFILVCQAIQHAHQKGIIHRDIKPSNILVTLHDGVPVPKVIDFGIAKATQQELTDKTVFTQFQQFIGTPAYISPEQAEISGLDIDTRADIYSLGVLLYELLVGQTPFDAKEMMKSGLDALRQIIREQEPLRPSTKLNTLPGEARTTAGKRRQTEVGKLVHQLQGDLDWIVMKCLEKDRTRRYETANSLAMDLQRHLANEPVVARPPSAAYRFRKAWQRNKLVFSAAAAVGVALIAGTGASSWQLVRATRAEELARERLAQVSAERDAKEQARNDAEAISAFLGDLFQQPQPARSGRTVTVAETLDGAAHKLQTDGSMLPSRRAKLQTVLGTTYFTLALYGEAVDLLLKAHDFYLTTLGPEHPDTLKTADLLAEAYLWTGRWDDTLKLREDTLKVRRKLLGPQHPTTINSMLVLANSYDGAKRLDDSARLREEVLVLREEDLERRRKTSGVEDPDYLQAAEALAAADVQRGHKEKARQLREQVVAVRKRTAGPENPITIQAMELLAHSCFDTGRKEEALQLREAVLKLRQKTMAPEDYNIVWAMRHLARSYTVAERHQEAIAMWEDVVQRTRKKFGAEHLETTTTMEFLADANRAAGRMDAALSIWREAMAIRRKVAGAENPLFYQLLGNLALQHHAAGKVADAITMQEEVVALRRKMEGPEERDTIASMALLATYYHDGGRKEEALKVREEVLRLYGKFRGNEHLDAIAAMKSLAASYREAGLNEEANALLQRTIDSAGKSTEQTPKNPATNVPPQAQ